MFAGRQNQFTVGGGLTDSRATFTQSTQFGYLTPDRGVADGRRPRRVRRRLAGFGERLRRTRGSAGDTRTRSVFFTDTWDLTPITHLTAVRSLRSQRRSRTAMASRRAAVQARSTATSISTDSISAVGVAITPSELLDGAISAIREGSRAPSAIERGCADPENPCKLPERDGGRSAAGSGHHAHGGAGLPRSRQRQPGVERRLLPRREPRRHHVRRG